MGMESSSIRYNAGFVIEDNSPPEAERSLIPMQVQSVFFDEFGSRHADRTLEVAIQFAALNPVGTSTHEIMNGRFSSKSRT